MNYTFRLRCAACGHDVRHRTAGTTDGFMTRAIGDCVNCGMEHRITVCLQTVEAERRGAYPTRKPPEVVRHGMPTMYRRGCRCGECIQAHARDARERRHRKLSTNNTPSVPQAASAMVTA